jgi:hypothetical protein
LPAFRKVLCESLRILPHQKPPFDLNFKGLEGFFRDDKLKPPRGALTLGGYWIFLFIGLGACGTGETMTKFAQ